MGCCALYCTKILKCISIFLKIEILIATNSLKPEVIYMWSNSPHPSFSSQSKNSTCIMMHQGCSLGLERLGFETIFRTSRSRLGFDEDLVSVSRRCHDVFFFFFFFRTSWSRLVSWHERLGLVMQRLVYIPRCMLHFVERRDPRERRDRLHDLTG
jgi:hypothetical protein